MPTEPTSETNSLRSLVQQELLQKMIHSTYEKSKEWMILVLDQRSTRILSSSLTMGDITNQGVSLVENITLKRMPFPDMHVLYFLTPSIENIKSILGDFPNERKSRYLKVHLFFLSHVDDDAMELIKSNSVLVKKILTFKEVNIDFLPVEHSAFTLEMPNCLTRLYSPLSLVYVNDEIEQISQRLVTVFATFKEYPYVRYKADRPKMVKLAQVFQRKMNHFVANNVNFKYRGHSGNEERATLLLTDRCEDLLSPLMHECTYQAIVHDLLMTSPEEIEYESEINTGKITKKALLNENDKLWVEFRHAHIAEVSQELSKRMHEFAATHSGASLAKGEIDDISLMASALKDLPEYREKLGKLAMHMSIAGKVMQYFATTKLLAIAQLEQTIATGVDEIGKRTKDVQMAKDIEKLLKNIDITSNDKTRLLAIFIISQQLYPLQDRKKLIKAAELPPEYERVLLNLRHLEGSTQYTASVKSPSATSKTAATKKIKAAKEKAISGNYTMSRYDPHLKETVQSLVEGNLSIEEYPYVILPPSGTNAGNKSQEKKVQSLRKRTTSKSNKEKEEHRQETFQGNRTIVFLVGGASYSELKTVYDIRNEMQKDLIVGTTDLLRPNDYLQSIGKLEESPEMSMSGISLDEVSLTAVNSNISALK